VIEFIIIGQPCSKANSRQIVTIKGRPVPIKSKAALAYESSALRQVPSVARVRYTGPVRVSIWIWYASERSDLDESLILDILQDRWHGHGNARVLMQAGVYRNDRQVRERHVYWAGVDARNARAIIRVEPMQAQQIGLPMPARTQSNAEFFGGGS